MAPIKIHSIFSLTRATSLISSVT